MRERTRAPARLLIASIGALLLTAPGCDTDSHDYAEEAEDPVEVSAEQEQGMCGDLEGSSTYKPASAGPSIDDCGAVDGAPGLKRVTLVDVGNFEYGGFLRLSVQPENESAVLLMIKEASPFQAVREDGGEVPFIENGESSEHCDVVNGRYLWTVDESTNYLEFGPTDSEKIDIVVEVVDE